MKGQWKYLYRAVDSAGNTIDFLLCAKRDSRAAERFFRKALKASHTSAPRVINVSVPFLLNSLYPPFRTALGIGSEAQRCRPTLPVHGLRIRL